MEKKLDERTRVDSDLRKKALVDFLGLEATEASDIEVSRNNDKVIDYKGEEYLVVTDDEADEQFNEYQDQLWNHMGIDSVTSDFKDWILNNAVEVSKTNERMFIQDIANMIKEAPSSYSSYFKDYEEDLKKELVKNRNFMNYVHDQYSDDIVEAGVTAEEYSENQVLSDFDEMLDYAKEFIDISGYSKDIAESMIGKYDSILDYVLKQGWYTSAQEALDNLGIFELDKKMIFDEIKDLDGRGKSLAGHDSEENETKYDGVDLFIYRQN